MGIRRTRCLTGEHAESATIQRPRCTCVPASTLIQLKALQATKVSPGKPYSDTVMSREQGQDVGPKRIYALPTSCRYVGRHPFKMPSKTRRASQEKNRLQSITKQRDVPMICPSRVSARLAPRHVSGLLGRLHGGSQKPHARIPRVAPGPLTPSPPDPITAKENTSVCARHSNAWQTKSRSRIPRSHVNIMMDICRRTLALAICMADAGTQNWVHAVFQKWVNGVHDGKTRACTWS